RRDRHRNADEWISLVACKVQPSPKDVDVKRESYYDEYPYPRIYPDMLPPDYPAILSLFMNVISIVWNNKFASWLGSAFLFTCFADLKFNEIDYTQVFVSIIFQILSFVRAFILSDQ
ncbi:hypothetical protein WA171_003185, partial [Blastocystis sp. BT1]